MADDVLLSVRNLTIPLPPGLDRPNAVEDISYDLQNGEILCVVGESGSGKSMTANAIMGLLPSYLSPSRGRILLEGRNHALVVVVITGAVTSAAVETLQYTFALGHSDVTDLIFNTTGALVGGLVAHVCGRRLYPLWIGLGLAIAAVFAILVILGPRLGDPEAVVELAATRGATGQAADAASAARP